MITLLFKYIILYLIIMLGSISISYKSKRKIDQTLPIYFIVTFIFLYIFGLLNILKIGLWLYLILNIIVDLYVLYKLIIKKEYKEYMKYINRPSLYIYTILYFLFMIFTKNAAFYIWDEFAFWSIATKNMYYSNSLYLNSATTLYNVGYPPCPTILEYFFAKIIGNYSQGIELFAYQMFGFALLMPLFKNSDNKKHGLNISILFAILFIPAIFVEGYFYKTIYADSLLGILVGYILYEHITSKKDKLLNITTILAIFVLSLTKATGVIFAGLIILFIGFNSIYKNKKINYKYLIILLFSMIVSFISWKLYVKYSNVNFNMGYTNAVNNSKSIMDMIKTIYATVVGSSYEINTSFQTFFGDFFDKPYYSSLPFGMTGSIWISIFVIAYILVYKYVVKDKKEFKKYSILLLVLAVMYLVLLQVAYFLKFSDMEAILHNSMQRYVGSLFIALLIVIVGVVFNENEKIGLLIPIILLPFTPVSTITNATIASGVINKNNQAAISNVRDFAYYVTDNTEENARIYPVHQTQGADSFLIQFRYFMTPRFIPMVDMFDDIKDNKYSFVKFNSKEEFEKELYEKFDYVVILNSNDYFNDNYSSLFEGKIDNWSIYKIVKENGKVELIKK